MISLFAAVLEISHSCEQPIILNNMSKYIETLKTDTDSSLRMAKRAEMDMTDVVNYAERKVFEVKDRIEELSTKESLVQAAWATSMINAKLELANAEAELKYAKNLLKEWF